MKKYAKIIAIILVVCTLSIALFACIDDTNDTQGKMTLVVLPLEGKAQEFSVDLSKLPSGENSSTGLMAVLDYLKSQNKLSYESNDAGYGAYLTKVGDLQEGNGYYVYIYTDVEEDYDVTQYVSTVTYKDKTYTSSGKGASLMSMKVGCTVIITLYSFG